MRSHVWGQVKLDTTGLIDRKAVRFMSDASIYAFGDARSDRFFRPEGRRVSKQPARGPDRRFRRRFSALPVFGADAMRSPRGLKAVGPYVVTKAMASGVSACGDAVQNPRRKLLHQLRLRDLCTLHR